MGNRGNEWNGDKRKGIEMLFRCAVCGQEVGIFDTDRGKYAARGWECDLCYSVIVAKRYQVNMPGAMTIFSPCSSALGDWIVESVVRERYKKDNPDETIVNLGLANANEAVRVYRPDKFFWASITNFMAKPKNTWWERAKIGMGGQDRKKIIEYSVAVEADRLALEGIYPEFEFGQEDFVDVGCERFAVLNFRNIVKVPQKNAEPYIVNHVLFHLEKHIQAGAIEKAVIVGNDDRDEMVFLPEWVVDYRKVLDLRQIASLCARSRVYVGKDCGVAHLAAAAGAKNMVVWGYKEPQWIVKAPKERFVALMVKDSSVTRIKAEIDKRMR